MTEPVFPKNFLWGASTSAHQVEGNNHNQWSEWEHANAERLADEASQKQVWFPIPPATHQAASKPTNYISGSGVEHYKRYPRDFALLKKLNLNAFRFSIEWSRIEPAEGRWDDAAIKHYRRYIQALHKLGIEPVLTLWHWTVPVWFDEKGGFEKRTNICYFERFVAKVSEELIGDIRYVITLNETNSYVLHGYVTRKWPPRKHFVAGFRAYMNLKQAHKRAYKAVKRLHPDCLVGMAPTIGNARPANPSSRWQKLVANMAEYATCWAYLGRLQQYMDFIGVNYYFTYYLDGLGRDRNPHHPLNDLGWYMEPQGIEQVVMNAWRRYHKPLLITENGLADATDAHRQWWLEETMSALRRAIAKGADLRGYLHWSLLDNFEWADGWWPKFGLIAVDRRTMRRTIRPSAQWLAAYIAKQLAK